MIRTMWYISAINHEQSDHIYTCWEKIQTLFMHSETACTRRKSILGNIYLLFIVVRFILFVCLIDRLLIIYKCS